MPSIPVTDANCNNGLKLNCVIAIEENVPNAALPMSQSKITYVAGKTRVDRTLESFLLKYLSVKNASNKGTSVNMVADNSSQTDISQPLWIIKNFGIKRSERIIK